MAPPTVQRYEVNTADSDLRLGMTGNTGNGGLNVCVGTMMGRRTRFSSEL